MNNQTPEPVNEEAKHEDNKPEEAIYTNDDANGFNGDGEAKPPDGHPQGEETEEQTGASE